MRSGQKIRSVLYYLSLFAFLIGLPIIISQALGYKFNPRTRTFTKTGIIFVKTQPAQAELSLDGKALNEKTPATIRELLPGRYTLKIELAQYYPWSSEVWVDAGKVNYLDKIILFPLRPDIKQLNKEKISFFWPEKEKSRIYYADYQRHLIYRSDYDGNQFHAVASLPDSVNAAKELKVSPDKEKILLFNPHQIVVINLEPMKSPFVLDYPDKEIVNVFWYSDSYHLVLVTQDSIEVSEAKQNPASVRLASLSKPETEAFYDDSQDVLYFIDSQTAPDGRTYDNLYKLDVRSKSLLLPELEGLIKIKADE